jgi:hypothetical protein
MAEKVEKDADMLLAVAVFCAIFGVTALGVWILTRTSKEVKVNAS